MENEKGQKMIDKMFGITRPDPSTWELSIGDFRRKEHFEYWANDAANARYQTMQGLSTADNVLDAAQVLLDLKQSKGKGHLQEYLESKLPSADTYQIVGYGYGENNPLNEPEDLTDYRKKPAAATDEQTTDNHIDEDVQEKPTQGEESEVVDEPKEIEAESKIDSVEKITESGQVTDTLAEELRQESDELSDETTDEVEEMENGLEQEDEDLDEDEEHYGF